MSPTFVGRGIEELSPVPIIIGIGGGTEELRNECPDGYRGKNPQFINSDGNLNAHMPDRVRLEEAPDIPSPSREAPATTLVPPEISSGRPGPHLVGLRPTYVQMKLHLSTRI